jgi:hypothetical protein
MFPRARRPVHRLPTSASQMLTGVSCAGCTPIVGAVLAQFELGRFRSLVWLTIHHETGSAALPSSTPSKQGVTALVFAPQVRRSLRDRIVSRDQPSLRRARPRTRAYWSRNSAGARATAFQADDEGSIPFTRSTCQRVTGAA